MAKHNRNSGKPWTPGEVKQLKQLANQNTPTRVIGLKLGRTENAVRSVASEVGSKFETDESVTKRDQKVKDLQALLLLS